MHAINLKCKMVIVFANSFNIQNSDVLIFVVGYDF